MRNGFRLPGLLLLILAWGRVLFPATPAAWQASVASPSGTPQALPNHKPGGALASPSTLQANSIIKKSRLAVRAPINITYQEAQPILDALGDNLPAELKSQTPSELADAWPGWVKRHDQDTRARLFRGDEDTMVNFIVLGTTFTRQPRFTGGEFAHLAVRNIPSQPLPDSPPEVNLLMARVDDFMHGLANPVNDERMLFLSQLVKKQGYRPLEASGSHLNPAEQDRLRDYLVGNVLRVVKEQQHFQEVYAEARQREDHPEDIAAVSTLYSSRGVSLDTSMLPNLAIEESLKAMLASGLLTPGSVHRAAIIGPGLDFTDKASGYDFYPEQTIQSFALADSLFRLGLARQGGLELTTFDISERVNEHLQRAIRRAKLGQGYVLQLPHDAEAVWTPPTSQYWRQFGDQIGSPVTPIQPPEIAGSVETRAVKIHPSIVSALTPIDLDIVTQRLDLPPQDGFDLIIATNVFTYFDSFEQLLAVANIQSMLRPGGFLLSNNALPLLPFFQMKLVSHLSVSYSDRPNDGDVISWYQWSPE